MVSIFKAPKKAKKLVKLKTLTLMVDGLDHEGHGVCTENQPVVFVPKTLPGEKIRASVSITNKRFWQGKLMDVIEPSPERITPKCHYYEQCGGCQVQHASADYMLEAKQKAVDSMLQKQLGMNPLPWQQPLTSKAWSYRRKARLAVNAQDDSHLKLGFRGEETNDIVDISHCAVLEPKLNELVQDIKLLIKKLKVRRYIGHISLLQGDNVTQVTFRITKDVEKNDRNLLAGFADRANIKLVLELHKGTFEAVSQSNDDVFISPVDGLKLNCEPNDFLQVNADVNRKMVQQAIQWLALNDNDKVADLFCGIGNFSLPLAKVCQQVVGLEGVTDMVQRATNNAQLNGIENADFDCVDLSQDDSLAHKSLSGYSVMLLDPARAGAMSVAQQLSTKQWKKILYVSCNPSTFARDAKVMQSKGFKLTKIGLLDMFPQTSHVELMALFSGN
ncbi:23S rRNA (uracil(1939)-C(5))-methyltransferase RlmD [Alteromonadaceae bacterium M269]|nr:23S rRNA (uracil(1939)-C(5))-methyltransferase RlmD [Alteromonadaceae bacterium M269]